MLAQNNTTGLNKSTEKRLAIVRELSFFIQLLIQAHDCSYSHLFEMLNIVGCGQAERNNKTTTQQKKQKNTTKKHNKKTKKKTQPGLVVLFAEKEKQG